MPREKGRVLVAQNRKARHDYHIEDTVEAGLVLTGTEVKSLREGRASLVDGYAAVKDGELWLHNVHIPEYTQGTWTNHEPRRARKLLLHREQIRKTRCENEGVRPHDHPDCFVLQGRVREGRDRRRARKEVVRQATRLGRTRSQARRRPGDRPAWPG